MRPALVLLAAEMCGYSGPRSVQIAAAIELLHTATLVHDDVVDVADVRRGKQSANAIWGNRRAVLAGDFFYGRASTMICEDGSLAVVRAFADTVRALSEGELLQLERSFDASITESQYYEVIARKSAKLLSTACETGSILAAVTQAEQRRLAEFGSEIGLAFQLRDDALDYDAPEATLGKAPLADLREGKVTMPLLLTLKRCAGTEREQIVTVLKACARPRSRRCSAPKPRPHPTRSTSRRWSRSSIATAASRTRCAARTNTSRRRTTRSPHFPDSQAKRALLAAASYAVNRDH